MKIILLIIIGLSILNAEFIKSGDTVTDNTLGLQWQDDSSPSVLTWKSALDQCNNLTLGGYSDWRLPNINELQSIVDRSKLYPSIVTGFTNTTLFFYWSSTTDSKSKDAAWLIDFRNGSVSSSFKFSLLYVSRCVRGS